MALEATVNGEKIVRDVVALGASAGGVEALIDFLKPLPRDLPATIIVVLHRDPHQKSVLAKVLGRHSSMPVVEPRDGDPLAHSCVYLAPQDRHLVVHEDRFSLLRTAKEHFTRPAIDPLFRSLAENFGERVIAILLSGLGDDGVSGMIAVKERNGLTAVQSLEEATYQTMPAQALLRDHVDTELSTVKLAALVIRVCQGQTVQPAGTAPGSG